MNVLSVETENFLTIKSAYIELNKRGLLLIQGVNDDDTSASSNGAGKSSIVDAISWCGFGETAREVSGDAVVNRKVGKDCKVVMIIEDDDAQYRIERYRKHSAHKNALYVFKMEAGSPDINMTKGTDKETQLMLEKIIGCTLPVFVGAIYSGQEKMPDLPGMTDKQLKLLIEEAAGVEELGEAYLEARKRSATVDAEVAAAGANIKSLESRIAAMRTELTNAQEQHKLFEDGRKDRAREELKRVPPYQTIKAGSESQLAKIDIPALEARKTALEKDVADSENQERKYRELDAKRRESEQKLTRFKTTVGHLKKTLDQQEEHLQHVHARVGSPCGECGKLLEESDIQNAKALREASVVSAKRTLMEAATGMKAAVSELAEREKELKEYAATMTDLSASVKEMSAIQASLNAAVASQNLIVNCDRDIAAIKRVAQERLAETNPWTKAVEMKTEDISKSEVALITAQGVFDALEEKRELYSDAVRVFGPAGVRAHILDTVTPFLNERTSEYLGVLADGNISAIWSTLTKTAKGEIREKFNIEVTNAKGGDSFKALSGGEKRKVRLAAAMALQDMVASRATKPINLFLADEIDDALDGPGLERLMTVLDKKAKERGTVLVISHNSLTDWIDSVITVTKKDGSSVVAGATRNGF